LGIPNDFCLNVVVPGLVDLLRLNLESWAGIRPFQSNRF
jgi:hypothetical protein